jgi:uncharacterized protein YhaN
MKPTDMSKPSLIIQELTIYKMPGFPRGMAPINTVVANINIIAGPNASGKSSTARIMQQALWRNDLLNIHLQCRIAIADKVWDIHIDHGHYSCQSEGKEDTLPDLPALDESKRYLLALHELIVLNDDDLAKQVMREAIGGYDLLAAEQQLGFESKPKGKTNNEYKTVERALKTVSEIEAKQKQLKHQEDTLHNLILERNKADKALKLLNLFEALIAWLKAKIEYHGLKERYDTCPKQLTKLTGQEYENILTLEKEKEDNDTAIQTSVTKISNKTDELDLLQLPEGGIDKQILTELELRVEQLLVSERGLHELGIAIIKAEQKTNDALKKIASGKDSNALIQLDINGINDLDQFLSDAHRLSSEKQFIDTGISQLKREIDDTQDQTDILNQGVRSLINWFQGQSTQSGIYPASLWILFVCGLATALTTYFLGWQGLIGLVAMIVYLLYATRRKNSDTGEIRKKDFRKTGLKEPEAWDDDGVLKRLEELNVQLQDSRWVEKIRQQINSQEEALESLKPSLNTLEALRETWKERLNIPEIPQENLKSYSGLYWFIKNLEEWQHLYSELNSEQQQKEKLQEEQATILSEINRLLEGINHPVLDGPNAKAIFKKLADDEGIRLQLVTDINFSKEQIAEKERQNTKANSKLKDIYDELELNYGNKDAIRELTEQLPEYKILAQEFQKTDIILTEKKNQLNGHKLFETITDELITLDLDTAFERHQTYQSQAAQLDELNRRITTIEATVQIEKQGHELEDALSARDSALDGLEQLYKNNISGITGHVIIDQLKQVTQEQNRTKVFVRANQLFNRITNGRYELLLVGSDNPVFKAFDTVLKIGQDLRVLSTGTRIQLLLSVRLAFIESQEQGVKLPIMVDEVLANSDDIRAKEIIKALVEISKEGRQVFYFTSQADEIAKWKHFLQTDPTLEPNIIELDGQPNEKIDYQLISEGNISSLLLTDIPKPGNSTKEAYGKMLNVPYFNLLTESPEQLHLWYLLDNNQLLFDCLKQGIRYYGPLLSYLNYGGKLENLYDANLERVQLKVKLLVFYKELYAQGRSKPIDRQVLMETGCVSVTFIDSVTAKLKELNNDPEKLIEALKAGAVTRFNKSKAEDMENYLLNQGYLDDKHRLTSDELLVRTRAFLSNLDLPEVEAQQFLESIVK